MADPILLLRHLFAAGDAGEVHKFANYLSEHIIVHAPFGLSTVGIQEEMTSWEKARASMPDLRHEFIDIISDGQKVSARCRVTGTMHGTYAGITAEGKRFAIDQALFAHVHDGKISELWEIIDTEALLDQLGTRLP
jgi:steroid delta-isomerase-like uncharacterized protein